jgi:hypothetical protein
MALTYTGPTAWDTVGTDAGSNVWYKDVTVSASTGDLLVAFGAAETQRGTTGDNGSIVTQSGSTSAWTQAATPDPAFNADSAFNIAWATVSASGSITVRVNISIDFTNQHMGAAVILIPAAEWTGTPAFTDVGPGDGDGQVSVTLANTSTVIFAAADWSAGTPSGSTPSSGATAHASVDDGERYAVAVRSWTGQTAATRAYGVASGGTDWTGSVVAIQEPAGGGGGSATQTAPVTAFASVPPHTAQGAAAYTPFSVRGGIRL